MSGPATKDVGSLMRRCKYCGELSVPVSEKEWVARMKENVARLKSSPPPALPEEEVKRLAAIVLRLGCPHTANETN